MALTTQEEKRMKELQKMKKQIGKKFPQERQWELDGLLKQQEDSK